MSRFRKYLWWKQTKHNIFVSPPKKRQQALSKRCKHLRRKFRLKTRNFKISLKLAYIIPFLQLFQNLLKNWKNNQFPSPNSFLDLKQHFKRLENRFWRKFEKSTKNSDLGTNRDTLFLRSHIFFVFGAIQKPFMKDEVQVIYFSSPRKFFCSSAYDALQALKRQTR